MDMHIIIMYQIVHMYSQLNEICIQLVVYVTLLSGSVYVNIVCLPNELPKFYSLTVYNIRYLLYSI